MGAVGGYWVAVYVDGSVQGIASTAGGAGGERAEAPWAGVRRRRMRLPTAVWKEGQHRSH